MKKIIKEEIYSKDFNSDIYNVRVSDLPKDIQENDIIHIFREKSFMSENNSYDSYTTLTIIREREESDDEYQKRITENEILIEELKSKRYETYLKLKKEFDN